MEDYLNNTEVGNESPIVKNEAVFKDGHTETIMWFERKSDSFITFEIHSGLYQYVEDNGHGRFGKFNAKTNTYVEIIDIDYLRWNPLDILRDEIKSDISRDYGIPRKVLDEQPDPPSELTNAIPYYPHILDSGTRREFETGAVRDIQEGKGRCDLLPLDVVASYMTNNHVIKNIYGFQFHGDILRLEAALDEFVENYTDWSGTPDMLLEVSKQFEEGAKKYGEYNWQKGIPTHCYIDSAVRHYLKWLRGDKDEPHDRAFCWNILCCIWTCNHKPKLNTYAKVKENESN